MKPDRATFLVPDEFRRLLAAARKSGGLAARNHLMLALAGNLGLRVSEVVALRIDSFHLAARPPFVRVVTRKRGKDEHDDLPLDSPLARAVKLYIVTLGRRAERMGVPAGTVVRGRRSLSLFPGRFVAFRPMSTRAAEKIFKQCAAAAGLDPLYSFHSLRHYCGMQAYRRTRDLNVVKKLLRHRSLSSTFRYQHADPGALARAATSIV